MTAWPRPALVNLRSILANLYPSIGDGMRLAKDADLASAQIAFSNKAITNWFEILERANNEQKVDTLVALAVQENPGNEPLQAAKNQAPPPPIEGPETARWGGTTSAGQLEKILGDKSTLVSIGYLELGLIRAKSVARIKRADGSSGTGFVAANGLVITNNHVLPDSAAAASSVLQFNYQRTALGLDAPLEEFGLAPDEFFRTSKDDDWSAVRINGDASKWGELELKPINLRVGDRVNIIQHPGGAYKQLSFVANVVVYVGDGRVQYLTDTLPGSSGSPVFDIDWNLVALHHSGGWLTEPNASSKSTYYRNEGIAISTIVEGLAANL